MISFRARARVGKRDDCLSVLINRLLAESQYFIEHLGLLDDVDGPGNNLEVVVNNIKIKDKRQYQSVQATNLTKGPGTNAGSNQSLASSIKDSTMTAASASAAAQAAAQNASKKASIFFGKMLRPQTGPAPAGTASGAALGATSGPPTPSGSLQAANASTQEKPTLPSPTSQQDKSPVTNASLNDSIQVGVVSSQPVLSTRNPEPEPEGDIGEQSTAQI